MTYKISIKQKQKRLFTVGFTTKKRAKQYARAYKKLPNISYIKIEKA